MCPLALPINFTICRDVVDELRDAVVEGEVAADDLRQGQIHRAVVGDGCLNRVNLTNHYKATLLVSCVTGIKAKSW